MAFKLTTRFDAQGFEKAVMQAAVDGLTKKVKNIRCSEHGEYAQIVAKGRSSSTLNFQVSGCCEQLIEKVKANLK